MVRVGKGGRLIVGRVGILGRCGFHHDPDLAGAADAGNAGADAAGAGAGAGTAGAGIGAGEDKVTLVALPMAVSIAL